jgi:hypothetical protein
MLIEQHHMIDTLNAQLHLALRRQFGPRNEFVDVDQLGLFAGDSDPSTVIECGVTDAEVIDEAKIKTDSPGTKTGVAPLVKTDFSSG